MNAFNLKKTTLVFVATVSIVSITGCATGQQYAANSYTAGQVNQRQAAATIEILAVMPAKVQVDNSQGRKAAVVGLGILGAVAGGLIGGNQGAAAGGALLGGLAGGAAGSVVSNTNMVDGVSLAYKQAGQVFNSAQVGQLCQFKPGVAIMVSSGGNETRIQPNATCPTTQAAN